jgi:hypothetical protein
MPAALDALTGSLPSLAVGLGAGATAWSVREWVTP